MIERREWRMLRDVLNDLSVPDLADVLKEIDEKNRAIAFRLLRRETAAEVFEHFESEEAESLLGSLKDPEAARILNAMSPDDRTELLEEVPDRVARRVMRLLSPEERDITQGLLAYPEGSVGRLMTPEYVKVKTHLTCRETLDWLRENGKDKETVYYIYLVDNDNVPRGVVSLRELVFSEPETKLEELLEPKDDVVTVRADADQIEAVKTITHYDLVALPVVDSRHRLVGIVTVDDVMDVQEEEATEDMQMMSGVVPTEGGYLSARIGEILPKRMVSLILLAITATLMGKVLQHYEDVLKEHENLAFFIIVLMAAAGNTGGQAGTLIIRALAIEDIGRKEVAFIAARELLIGVMLALGVGAVVAAIGLSSFDIERLEMSVICGALVVAIVLANLFGALLPIGLRAIRLDPAFFSTPLITTVSDLIALFALFMIAARYLGVGAPIPS